MSRGSAIIQSEVHYVAILSQRVRRLYSELFRGRSLSHITNSIHFALALILLPSEEGGQYEIYNFDSLQDAMTEKLQRRFALLLWEAQFCNDGTPDTCEYDTSEFEKFMNTRVRYFQVQVRSMF